MSVEDLRTALADYEDWLEIYEEGEYIIVKPKSYNNAKWQKVSPQVREFGGIWVSIGKQSRWQIKREASSQETSGVVPRSKKDRLLHEAIQMIKRHTDEIKEFLARWEELEKGE